MNQQKRALVRSGQKPGVSDISLSISKAKYSLIEVTDGSVKFRLKFGTCTSLTETETAEILLNSPIHVDTANNRKADPEDVVMPKNNCTIENTAKVNPKILEEEITDSIKDVENAEKLEIPTNSKAVASEGQKVVNAQDASKAETALMRLDAIHQSPEKTAFKQMENNSCAENRNKDEIDPENTSVGKCDIPPAEVYENNSDSEDEYGIDLLRLPIEDPETYDHQYKYMI